MDQSDFREGGLSAQANAPRSRRYPDFIIGGAPKCGTTSLHFILDQHADISLPVDEVHFFDADDPITHPDFLHVHGDTLVWPDPRPSQTQNLDWYAERFAEGASAALLGEDSTTYLMSELAPARIHALIPDVRLIFMLRHPVSRAYSQYWHLVKTGRTTKTFEQAILHYPNILLGSSYLAGLRRFQDTFGPEQIKVCLFEDFRADNQACVDDVTAFIGAKPMQIDPDKAWFNRTKYPGNLNIQRLSNVVGNYLVRKKYRQHMAKDGSRDGWVKLHKKLHYRWFRHVNSRILTADRPPEMREDTKAYLQQHLSARNAGLSKLLDRDLSTVWTGMQC